MSRVYIVIGEGRVTLRSNTSSTKRVAVILGREVHDRVETIWLDRLVHRAADSFEDGWQASGCLSTVLTRTVRSSILREKQKTRLRRIAR